MTARLLTLLLCLTASPAFSAVTYDTVSSGEAANATSLSFNHTMSASANGLLLCGVAYDNGSATISSATFNSVSMGAAYASADNAASLAIAIFKLVAPASGTHAFEVTMNIAGPIVAGCLSFTDVDQSVPLGTAVNDVGDTSLSASITVPVSGLGASFLVENTFDGGSVCGDRTSGQTERFDLCESANNYAGAGSTGSSTGSVAYTWALVGSDRGVMIAVPINVTAAAAAATHRRVIVID